MSITLSLENVCAGYGQSVVLHNVSLKICAGSSLAVLGRNGMGKSTLLTTLAGMTELYSGRITLDGKDLTTVAAYRRARMGLGWVPQDRAVFTTLTVDENLRVVARPGYWNPKRIYDLFPRLATRRRHLGAHLSGGEQQMLSIGRALMLNPAVLLLDEPLEGLAPMVVADLRQTFYRLIHEHGMSLLIVEQHPHHVLPITAQTIILDRGRIVHHTSSRELLADPHPLERWIGMSTYNAHHDVGIKR